MDLYFTCCIYVLADLVIGAYRSQQVYVLRYGTCLCTCVPYCIMKDLKQKTCTSFLDFMLAQKTLSLYEY